jgi:hypothetical protein
MPHRIKALYKEIMKHPKYETRFSETKRWAFEAGCVGGGSWCEKQNNKWCRKLWRQLYWDEPTSDDEREVGDNDMKTEPTVSWTDGKNIYLSERAQRAYDELSMKRRQLQEQIDRMSESERVEYYRMCDELQADYVNTAQ